MSAITVENPLVLPRITRPGWRLATGSCARS